MMIMNSSRILKSNLGKTNSMYLQEETNKILETTNNILVAAEERVK
jgi:hypothetical protein